MTVIVGPEQTNNASILALRSALRMEVRGMKLSRGRSALAIAKSRGLTTATTKVKALADLDAYIEANIRPPK